MPDVNIKCSYHIKDSDTSKGKLYFEVADSLYRDPLLLGGVNVDIRIQNFTLGTLDAEHHVFPTFDAAFDYYKNAYAADLANDVSTVMGTSYTVGEIYKNPETVIALAAKQDVITPGAHIAAPSDAEDAVTKLTTLLSTLEGMGLLEAS